MHFNFILIAFKICIRQIIILRYNIDSKAISGTVFVLVFYFIILRRYIMNSVRYSYEQLKTFCNDAFCKFGFSAEESQNITDVLLLADLYGIESHGMQRLVRYHKGIASGLIKLDAKPETVFETPVSAIIDGHSGMGQLIAIHAMNLAIEKAKKSGIAIISVKNSNHFGIAGYYSKMACDQGFIGFAMTNSEAIMVPTFSRLAMLGSNPLAVSVPAKPYPFFFDASTTVVTRGKLEVYNKLSKPLPEGWALNESGLPCTDADKALKCIAGKKGGGIMPLGGNTEQLGSHKGYGYAMICEIFSSVFSGGLTSNHTYNDGTAGVCHGFMAINPEIFGSGKELEERFSLFLQELRDAPKSEGQSHIYTHGEKEIAAYADRMKNGIDVNINTVAEMKNLCDYLEMDSIKYLGDVDFSSAKQSFCKQ